MKTTTKRWTQRAGNRGVAMVEAGILAPVFAMMMMMTMYLGGTYETKYRTVMMSRYATWSYAANGCQAGNFKPIDDDLPPGIKLGGNSGGAGPQLTQPVDPQGGTGGNGSASKYTSGAVGAGGASAGSAMGSAKGTSTMTWIYTPGISAQFQGAGQAITTQSQTLCGPVPDNGMDPFSFIKTFPFP